MLALLIGLAIVLGLVWTGALVYSSVQPRLVHRRQRLHLEGKTKKARAEREERNKILDKAMQNLAANDVDDSIRGDSSSRAGLENHLPGDFEITRSDMDYVNENYSKFVQKEMNKQMDSLAVEKELISFDDVRNKHRDTIKRIREDHQRLLEQARDPYAEEFASLEEDTGSKSRFKLSRLRAW